MNSSSTAQQTAQTAQNILSEERSFLTVQFAITGVPEADFLSGLHALFGLEEFSKFSRRHRLRLLEYLAQLYRDSVEDEEKTARSWQGFQGLGAAQIQTQSAINPNPFMVGIGSGTLGSVGQQSLSALPDPQPHRYTAFQKAQEAAEAKLMGPDPKP